LSQNRGLSQSAESGHPPAPFEGGHSCTSNPPLYGGALKREKEGRVEIVGILKEVSTDKAYTCRLAVCRKSPFEGGQGDDNRSQDTLVGTGRDLSESCTNYKLNKP